MLLESGEHPLIFLRTQDGGEHVIDVYNSSSSNGAQQLQRGPIVSDCSDGPGMTERAGHSGNGAR